MDTTNTTRKSCDLCYRRKMKCDRQKPRCSHCRTYKTACTFTAPSREPSSKKRRCNTTDKDAIEHMQAHLRRLELLVEQTTKRLGIVEENNGVNLLRQVESPDTITTVMRSKITSEGQGLMTLPPLDQVLLITQIYLQGFNQVLPLFHADDLLHVVNDCYRVKPPQRDPVAWAAIHVVLALAQRHNRVDNLDVPPSATCLSRAESVLSRIVLGDIQLLNVQVLAGMVMLLQASNDLKPALILIATTMRLAHSIGLHDQIHSANLSALHARQRACVFWLAYILDKDLSMRSKQPSVQIDDDVNLELPSSTILHVNEDGSEVCNPENTMGVITATDGATSMNYLTARVQLAAIEGGIYDYIYSAHSGKRNAEERSGALQSLARALEQWKASIPPEFSASAGSTKVAPGLLYFLGVLHSTSLACTTLINQVNAWDDEWIAHIRRYDGQRIEPLLPSKWQLLVCEARDLLLLFRASGKIDHRSFRMTGCSYITAMVLLIANSMQRPEHDQLFVDNHLIEIGLKTIARMVNQTNDKMLQSFQTICVELHQHMQRRCTEAVTRAE